MRVRPKPFRISIFAFRPKLAAMFQCLASSVKGFTVYAARCSPNPSVQLRGRETRICSARRAHAPRVNPMRMHSVTIEGAPASPGRAHLDTTTGARAVPARSTSLGRGILDNSRVFTPDKPLRTGTVRGPAVVVSRCAPKTGAHPDTTTKVRRMRAPVAELESSG